MTIYDVRSTPDDSGMLTVGVFAIVLFGTAAAAGWKRSTDRIYSKGERRDRSFVLFAVVALLGATYLLYRFAQLSLWQSDLESRRYVLIDGCVRDFSEELQREGLLGVDHFTLGDRRFTLSDSGWRLGYHLSHAHGSPIGPNAHLKVAAAGRQLLRIEIYPEACPLTGGSSGGARQ
jgi:hypothetical protein